MRGDEGVVILFSPPLGGIADIFCGTNMPCSWPVRDNMTDHFYEQKFEGSVAPRERINISYVPKTDGQTAEVELPLNMLVVGDTGNTQETSPLDERQAVSVNKHNFGAVMAEAAIGLNFTVPATLKEAQRTMS